MRNLLLTIMTLAGVIALMTYASSEDIAHKILALKDSESLCDVKYIRKDWGSSNSNSDVADYTTGYYTGEQADATDVDHVVAVKDAHNSGGDCWSKAKKEQFYNDSMNHVAALPHINRAKSDLTPRGFWNKIKEKEYNVSQERFCGYISIYTNVKKQYELSDTKDDKAFLDEMMQSCKNQNLITQN